VHVRPWRGMATDVLFLSLYFAAVGSFLHVLFVVLVHLSALQIRVIAAEDLSVGNLHR
jgi:hypothetical protein